jgi:glycosidase
MTLRKENAALSQGDYVAIDSGDKDVFAFARLTPKGEGAIIVLNCSADTKTLHLRGLPAKAKWGDLILASPATTKMDSTQISIAPYGVVINQFSAQ